MNRIDLQFLMLAAILLIAGVALGIFMGISGNFQLSPVHAHINLVGWTSLGLFGLTYRAYPELAERKLARVHLLLCAPAAVLLPPGIAISALYQSPGLAIIASLLWLGGCAVFLVQLLGLVSVSEGSQAPAPAE
ncbi:MAG TPA: hypothetical protein VNT25_05265 [Allosphingosinicella sp.]|nr:hypothetical protein [Allosphingosinicella sp.]